MLSSQNYNNNIQQTTPRTLSQLIGEVCGLVNNTFKACVWVTAELSDVRPNAQSGHCYMTLLEKDPNTGQILAQIRAVIWSNRWFYIRENFRLQTGQEFSSGLKVMLCVQVQLQPQYGLGVSIWDVNPSYTMGELERNRRMILAQLQKDGVLGRNKTLPFPALPQRIAIISAQGAAGYQDFRQELRLQSGASGIVTYTRLFAANMQGKETGTSIISALAQIYQRRELFDIVVIIRGGGATVDLASFDNYELAYNIALFPMPVITGIGHDRDKTVLDEVSHISVKTPTAAAQYIAGVLNQQLQHISDLQQALVQSVQIRVERERTRLVQFTNAISGTRRTLTQHLNHLNIIGERIKSATEARITAQRAKLDLMERTVKMAQPDDILKRGFSIVRNNGHAIKSAADVPVGTTIHITTADGELWAKIDN